MDINNLKAGQQLTFQDLVNHGLSNGANVNNGMPWSWKINGYPVTHENDSCYLIQTIYGIEKFEDGDVLDCLEDGSISIFKKTVIKP